MHRRLRRMFTALKEKSCVSYAKMATAGGFCSIDLIIVKATAPDDLPLPERYVHQLLNIFVISPSSFRAFSLGFSRRFGKTRCWRVALKCLLFLHRLLKSLPECSPFRSELLRTRSNGLISLNPNRFRDDSSSSAPEDYTAFIRSYAQLLDEELHCFFLDCKVDNDVASTAEILPEKMKQMDRQLQVLVQLQSLIDRIMDCRPSGYAAKSFIVRTAMKHIIRDSFLCYAMFKKEIGLVLDSLLQMPDRSCISAFGIYKKAALQANQLCEFYAWCRAMKLCGSYEYPFVEQIPQIQIQALEKFLSGMWQLKNSSPTTSPSLPVGSSFSLIEEEEDQKQLVRRDVVITTEWEKFEEDYEKQPLIKFEGMMDKDNWEDLLEASVNMNSCVHEDNEHGLKLQMCNPYAHNPFHQFCYDDMPNYHKWLAQKSTCSWGL